MNLAHQIEFERPTFWLASPFRLETSPSRFTYWEVALLGEEGQGNRESRLGDFRFDE
jgi:hypothetical protein